LTKWGTSLLLRNLRGLRNLCLSGNRHCNCPCRKRRLQGVFVHGDEGCILGAVVYRHSLDGWRQADKDSWRCSSTHSQRRGPKASVFFGPRNFPSRAQGMNHLPLKSLVSGEVPIQSWVSAPNGAGNSSQLLKALATAALWRSSSVLQWPGLRAFDVMPCSP